VRFPLEPQQLKTENWFIIQIKKATTKRQGKPLVISENFAPCHANEGRDGRAEGTIENDEHEIKVDR